MLPRMMTYAIDRLQKDIFKNKERSIHNRRILIVDDEPYNLMGLEVLLQ